MPPLTYSQTSFVLIKKRYIKIVFFLYFPIFSSIKKRCCKDSIYNDPKLISGSNVKGSNNKFVERGCQKTRLTPKEKRLNFTFIDGLALI